MPFTLVADFPVLAVHTAQVAPAEKNGARPAPATQRIFFAMMRTITVHHRPFTAAAYRTLDGLSPVHMTVAGTQIAVFQMEAGLSGALCQCCAVKLRQVGGSENLAVGILVFM